MKISLSKQAAKYYEKAPANIQDKFEKAFQSILEGEGDIKAMRLKRSARVEMSTKK